MLSLDKTEEEYLKLRAYIVGRYVANLKTISQSHLELKDRAEDLLLVSDHALSVAIDEVIKDFKFMKFRRPEGTELSAGKMAGILAFRLSRWAIIGTSSSLIH
jgi:hypothetical protein